MAKALIDRLQERIPGIPATRALIAANLLVFVAMLFSGAGLWHSPNGVQLAWGANFGPATQDGEWWRLASAMFLHFGALHLGLNMWALWDGGQWVERMYGHARFLALYLAAGLAGNLASTVFHAGQAVSGGASGAIFGLYGALLAYLWLRRRELHPQEFRWLFGFALAFSALTIAFGLVVTGIDNAAHLGGFVTGILLGIALLPESGQCTRRVLAASGIAALVVVLIAALPQPAYRWHDEVRAREEIGQFLREDAAITDSWNRLLAAGERDRLSFDELARRIERDVSARYQHSFEELSALPDDPALPSAGTVERLRDYAERRRDASRELAEGLRERNPQKIGEALREAQGKRAE
ncbi:MAG: rhomboid family intramembrane serine protease [Rhodocyclaceae bacterium]|nr:rhomboid family intramembrane serine protease [Rhodocyclaceae bacterium]